jgi:hypothetical protein
MDKLKHTGGIFEAIRQHDEVMRVRAEEWAKMTESEKDDFQKKTSK